MHAARANENHFRRHDYSLFASCEYRPSVHSSSLYSRLDFIYVRRADVSILKSYRIDAGFSGLAKNTGQFRGKGSARSDGPSSDLHAAFGSRCPRICIRKGGAHRFLPLSLLLSSRCPSRISSLSLLTPWYPHLWVTGSACRVVNSMLKFR